MKKVLTSLLILFFVIPICSSTSLFKKEGSDFIGKTEKRISMYFRYDGYELPLEETLTDEQIGLYDKVVYYTNKEVTYTLAKTTTTTYKTTKSSTAYNFNFCEFSDGCRTEGKDHYQKTSNIYSNGTSIESYVHRNNNGYINSYISEFNKIINRSDVFPESYSRQIFENSNIGDYYYLYSISKNSKWFPARLSTSIGGRGSSSEIVYSGEYATMYYYKVYEIHIVADDRSKTETHKISYNDKTGEYIADKDKKTKLVTEEAWYLLNGYISDGFSVDFEENGISIVVGYKDGKAVDVYEYPKNSAVYLLQ